MEQRLIVTYDISHDKTRNALHKFLSSLGVNSQRSVFEMKVAAKEKKELLAFLSNELALDAGDSVRVYQICASCERHVTRLGDGIDLNPFLFEII